MVRGIEGGRGAVPPLSFPVSPRGVEVEPGTVVPRDEEVGGRVVIPVVPLLDEFLSRLLHLRPDAHLPREPVPDAAPQGPLRPVEKVGRIGVPLREPLVVVTGPN